MLIVEDDPEFAQTIKAYLARAGFAAEVAGGTMDALTKAGARAFDILLVDVAMPKGTPSGLAFARMVRYRQAGSRIIFLTAYPELADAAAQLPGKVFVKPVDLDEIVAEIRAQLV